MKMIRLLASNRFFAAIVGLLALQSIWIALSGRYPMAFDEDFHLGIIRLYASHPLPFWSGQPANADAFGAVARDPSYLFQYLMSFPYALTKLFTDSIMAQVLVLRAINIALFCSGLYVWRRLLLLTGASQAVVQSVLALFILIPVVPLLAAQINYDNILFPLIGLVFLLTIRLDLALRSQKMPLGLLFGWASTLLISSVIKYAFLPIGLVVGVYIIYRLWSVRRLLRPALRDGYRTLGLVKTVLWVIILLSTTGLSLERYGVNIARYHTPVPDCGQVLSVKQCSRYGPWIRDYNFAHDGHQVDTSTLGYADDWFYGMWLRMFFAVDGPGTQFQTRGPLLIPAVSAVVLSVLSVVVVIVAARRLLRKYDRPALLLLISASLFYTLVLFVTNYGMFKETGRPVAINGLYLVLIALPLMTVAALALNELLQHRQRAKIILLTVAILSFTWGGGALTYILRSNDAWYWPNHNLSGANHGIQRTVGPLTPGYNKPSLFLR